MNTVFDIGGILHLCKGAAEEDGVGTYMYMDSLNFLNYCKLKMNADSFRGLASALEFFKHA